MFSDLSVCFVTELQTFASLLTSSLCLSVAIWRGCEPVWHQVYQTDTSGQSRWYLTQPQCRACLCCEILFPISLLFILKVPYHKNHVFSGVYIYKLVLPEPAIPSNEENKRDLHGLCSPPTGNMELLQAVQIQLLSLRNEGSHYHRPASTARW